MHVLFVHPNFPAQFRYLAPRLAKDLGWRCSFATRNDKAPDLPGVERVPYRPRGGASQFHDPLTQRFANTVAHARGAYEALKDRPDLRPDLVVAHSGFGSSLFLPQLYDCPVVNFFETFYRLTGQCLGFRPEFETTELDVLRTRTANAMILLDLDSCDRGWSPNAAQRDALPREYHAKVEVIPEGVDSGLYRRRHLPGRGRTLPDGRLVPDGARVVTYVARGLELARGFDVFMAAAKLVRDRFPDAVFAIAGNDRAYYLADCRATGQRTLRRRVLDAGGFDAEHSASPRTAWTCRARRWSATRRCSTPGTG